MLNGIEQEDHKKAMQERGGNGSYLGRGDFIRMLRFGDYRGGFLD